MSRSDTCIGTFDKSDGQRSASPSATSKRKDVLELYCTARVKEAQDASPERLPVGWNKSIYESGLMPLARPGRISLLTLGVLDLAILPWIDCRRDDNNAWKIV